MGKRERMTPADAAWLRMDRPTNLMVITGLMWFGEPLDWDRHRALVAERLAGRYPRLRQRVVESPFGLGRPSWEDDDSFDLDNHLEHVELPAPGDRAALQRFVSEVMSTPLDRSRPLWKLWVVDGFQGGSAVVSRLHHALADGISLARVILSLADEAPGTEPGVADGPAREPLPERAVHLLGDVVGEAWELATHPGQLVRLAGQALAVPGSFAKVVLSPPDTPSALKGRLGTSKRAAWSDRLPLADVKAIGKDLGATVNDVLLAAMTGGLRRVLEDRGTPVRDLRAFVPFNLRPLDRPVPTSLGNRFGLVMLDLPVGIADPHGRLTELKRRMDAIKAGPDGLVTFGILNGMGLSPLVVERVLVEMFGAKGTFVMTNVPGPRQPLSLAGTPVAGIMAWVPQSAGIGVGISIMSYAGDVVVGVTVDEQVVGDPQPVLDAFHAEVAALAALEA